MCWAKQKNGIAKQSTGMKCLQKIGQNWSLNCENPSIIGDLMRDPANYGHSIPFWQMTKATPSVNVRNDNAPPRELP